jgi:hypothetical protein
MDGRADSVAETAERARRLADGEDLPAAST